MAYREIEAPLTIAGRFLMMPEIYEKEESMTLTLFALLALFSQDGERMLDEKLHHLGNDNVPEWKETTPQPEGKELRVTFQADVNEKEYILLLTQRDIHETWRVHLNGTFLGNLVAALPTRETEYTIPKGLLKKGENTLLVTSKKPQDDIIVGNVRLLPITLRERYRLGKVVVSVTNKADGKPLPVRIGVTNKSGRLVRLFNAAHSHTAQRTGIFYTMGKGDPFEVPAGEYTLTATRGMEWSLASQTITVGFNEVKKISLSLTREVDTTGFIAADTHIHTLTYSGHGDSSVEERMVTLAGEGVELAIATDHNHNTDYRPFQEKMDLTPWFTPVVGNEVTTPNGHFNAFPLNPKEKVPYHSTRNWVKLFDGIRKKGAKVIILNHPHWPDLDRGPFGVLQVDSVTADRKPSRAFGFDAMELVNSSTKEPQPMTLFSDWFNLLNRGERITAVGSSDSHSVGEPVGQGRTYVASSTDDAAKIDIDEACRAFTEAKVSVSLGIFSDIQVDEKAGMGETHTPKGESIDVRVLVAAPAWITPERTLFFLNGKQVHEEPVPTKKGEATRTTFSVKIPLPAHDAHLVAITFGKGVTYPGWRTRHNYTLAATNPIYLDVDGDGIYRSPRETAARLLKETGKDETKILALIREANHPIALQMVSLLSGAKKDISNILLELEEVHPSFRDYRKYLRKARKDRGEHKH